MCKSVSFHRNIVAVAWSICCFSIGKSFDKIYWELKERRLARLKWWLIVWPILSSLSKWIQLNCSFFSIFINVRIEWFIYNLQFTLVAVKQIIHFLIRKTECLQIQLHVMYHFTDDNETNKLTYFSTTNAINSLTLSWVPFCLCFEKINLKN